MIRRLIQKLRKYSTATEESDTAYNGLGSYAVEWHAIEYGLGLGLMTGLGFLVDPSLGTTVGGGAVGVVVEAMRRDASGDLPLPRRYIRQIRQELHYYLGAFAVGFAPFVPLIDLRVVLGAVRKALGA